MTSPAQEPAALELRNLSKSFASLRAVQDVSLRIEQGSIAGIIGENGAGKSTLMNLVYGLHQPDAGDILVDDRKVLVAGPRDALRLGIGMVHQHFMLVGTLTVLENVVLGAEGEGSLAKVLARGRRELRRIAARFGLTVDPDALVDDLPVGEQQRIEILKALFRGARLLILDEPTAVLSPQEADRLFSVLRQLAVAGAGVILITHKLHEIMAVTDRVHVMRSGRLVASRATAATRPDELAALMIGSALPPPPLRTRRIGGRTLLRVSGLTALAGGCGRPPFANVDLKLRAGEIVGIAGVTGNGQSELLETLAGMRPIGSGRVALGSTEVTASEPADPARMRRFGVAHVPEHRHRHGMVGQFEAAETSILGYHRRPGLGVLLLDRSAVERACARLMRRFDVRPRAPGRLSDHFSGGNQQKLVIAREIAARPSILLVGQPTRGVDIAATVFIHAELSRLRDEGCAILLVSSELEEVVALADRILVMADGQVAGELLAGEADPARLGLMMAGARKATAAGATAGAAA